MLTITRDGRQALGRYAPRARARLRLAARDELDVGVRGIYSKPIDYPELVEKSEVAQAE